MKTWINRNTGQIEHREHCPGKDWVFVEPITRAEAIALWVFVAVLVGLLIYLSGK
jgi:hypothetical protein